VAGGIVEREAAIHVSNVMLFNPLTKKATGSVFACWRMDARCVTSNPITKL
jgi:ribosomal protein L24